VECLKHMPQVESEESSFENDPSTTDPGSVGASYADESSDKILSAANDPATELDDDGQTSASPKITQTEVTPSGRTSLVNAPVVTDNAQTPKVVKNRHP